MIDQEYQKGYEAGCKHGYQQGYKEGMEAGREAGRKEAIRSVSNMPDISDKTRLALFKMGQKAHQQRDEDVSCRSCLDCVDGGIDMPYCSECNPKNGFAYFRKKA
jgi:hypothetical protein